MTHEQAEILFNLESLIGQKPDGSAWSQGAYLQWLRDVRSLGDQFVEAGGRLTGLQARFKNVLSPSDSGSLFTDDEATG